MGTEEAESEVTTHPTMKEPGPVEKETESSTDSPQTPENTDPLNTYKWHTGSKGGSEELKEAGAASSPSSTLDKLHKASTNKWKTMQNWRKALSEDPGDKAASNKGAEGSKDPSKSHGGGRKNPFRRALSEPPGALFSTQSGSSSQAAPASSFSGADTEASGGSPSTDPGQKGAAGGGALLKKYLRTVSQKLKRPRLQSRSSNPAIRTDVIEVEPALSELPWMPHQEVPLWDISNCVLEHGQILIAQEEEPTMWTRNRVSSCLSNLSMQNLVDMENGYYFTTLI